MLSFTVLPQIFSFSPTTTSPTSIMPIIVYHGDYSRCKPAWKHPAIKSDEDGNVYWVVLPNEGRVIGIHNSLLVISFRFSLSSYS